jgi:hypothetical protein
MSDASSASMPDKRRKTPVKRPKGLAAKLGETMPLLGPMEWDFRWVTSQSQWSVATGYEIGREVIRQANYILKQDHSVASVLHPAWRWFVVGGGLEKLMYSVGSPGMPESSLARVLEPLVSSFPDFGKLETLPPSSFGRKPWIRSQAKKKQPKQALLFQSQVVGEWLPDTEDDGAPRDLSELLVWGPLDISYPCHKVVMHVPMLQLMTRKEAQHAFANWVAGSGLFIGPGRSPMPKLLQLAFFRFNQGREGLNQSGAFRVQFEPRNAKEVNKESSPFGVGQYHPIVASRYGNPNVLWSKSIKDVMNLVRPYAEQLAHMVELSFARRPTTPWTGKLRKIDERGH